MSENEKIKKNPVIKKDEFSESTNFITVSSGVPMPKVKPPKQTSDETIKPKKEEK